MKQITLIRHAKAVDGGDFDDDHERPLRGRGHRASAELGRQLAERPPSLILSSTALRTRQTVAGAIAGWPETPPIRYERELYLAPPAIMLRRLERLEPQFGTVWLVGHNPGMHDVVRLLAARAGGVGNFPESLQSFPTAARAVFAIDADFWCDIGQASLELLDFVVSEAE